MTQQLISPDYTAVRHVLGSPLIAARTAPYVGKDDFDLEGLVREAETMSGGEAVLVRTACELWTAERQVGLSELVRRLDAPNFERVLEALRIARGSLSWDAVERIVAEQEELAA